MEHTEKSTTVLFEAGSGESQPEERDSVKGDQKGRALEEPAAKIIDLFRFASGSERLQVVMAVLFSGLQGVILPVFTIVISTMGGDYQNTDSYDTISAKMSDSINLMLLLGGAVLVSSFISCALWATLAASQTARIKEVYLRSLMFRNTEWFDGRKTEEVAADYVREVSSLGVIFAQKMHFFVMYYTQMIAGIVVCFYIGWLYTVSVVVQIPFMFIGLYLYVRGMHKAEAVHRRHESKATMLFENAVNLIKWIKAIGGEEAEIRRFNAVSESMKQSAVKTGYKAGVYWGFLNFVGYMALSLSFLFGFKLLENHVHNDNAGRPYSASDIISILFSVLPPIVSMGNIGSLEQFIRAGAKTVSNVVKAESEVEELRKTQFGNLTANNTADMSGEIVFDNVSFSYPGNKKARVLKDFNMTVKRGEKVAVVGPSGCGKTTVIQLIERFYEPDSGRITVGGKDIRSMDPAYLRSKIGLVSQHALLFSGTVKENLLMGVSEGSVKDDEIWDILGRVGAKEFVEGLPGRLDAQISGSGGGLSNGQRQKLSIARSLIKKPSILLFDEATNSLDKREEQEVRVAIDEISRGCTAIIIDHKMSKVSSSDRVFVLDHGIVVETGKPEELLKRPNSYYSAAVHRTEDSPGSEDEIDIKSQVSQNAVANSNRNILKLVESSAVVQEPTVEETQGSVETAALRDIPWVRKVVSSLAKQKGSFAVAVLFTCLNGFVVAMFGYLVAKVRVDFFALTQIQIDNGVSGLPGSPEQEQRRLIEKSLDESFVLLFVIGLGTFVLNFVQLAVFAQTAEELVCDLRGQYFRKMMFLDMKFFDLPEFHPGHLALTLNKSTALIKTALSVSFAALLQMTAAFLVGLFIATLYSREMAITAAVITLVIIVFKFIESRFTSYYAILSREMNLKVLTETLGNMRTVRSLNAELPTVNRLTVPSLNEKRRRFRMSLLAGLVFGFSQLINYAGYGLLFIFGMVYGRQFGVTVGDVLTCFLMMVISMYGVIVAHEHISSLSQGIGALKAIVLPLFYVSEIEEDTETSKSVKRQKSIVNWIDKVEFKNVDFRYFESGKFVLHRFNLVLSKGSITGVFGKSASGKSAIVELLLRFYEPSAGSITVNDVPIQDIELRHLRSVTGVLLQDTRLFNDTIDANIRGPKQLSDSEVRELAQTTNSLNFIYSSPEGFKRVVGQFGQNLSGGQRQRILLARFFGRIGLINLLDEPTSALDLNNEKKMQTALANIKAERISVVFSSRPTSFAICDQVAVLHNGRIVERGTVQELMDKKGRFYSISRN